MNNKRWIGPLRLIGVGWYIAICIVLGIVAGLWLDEKVGLKPLFTLVGLFIGLASAFWGVYRLLFPAARK